MKNKARHAFGSEKNIDSAIRAGKLDAYDLLFLDEGKIGWIDKDLNKVIIQNDVAFVQELPERGNRFVLYVVNGKGYTWNGTRYIEEFVNTDVMDQRLVTDAESIIIDPETKVIKAIVEGTEVIISSAEDGKDKITEEQIEALFAED